MNIYFIIKVSFMHKPTIIVKAPQQLSDLQHFFLKEFKTTELKTSPITLPFFNFVCYTVDLFTEYVKSPLDISFNVFVVDSHLRKYKNSIEVYRRFMGFVNSWKQYSEKDEAKLFLSFLRAGRNNKHSIKLFLKIRKVLLKNISHKILQQIIISHEDAVTITHTLQIISSQQRKTLTKKINEYFITKTVKASNAAKFNAAIICEYFMVDLNDKLQEVEKFSTNKSSNQLTYVPKTRDNFIEEFSEESIDRQESQFSYQSLSNQFQTCKKVMNREDSKSKYAKENVEVIEHLYESESKKPLVNLQKCMKQLFILKEKDMQIDNRFKKISKVRDDVDQY